MKTQACSTSCQEDMVTHCSILQHQPSHHPSCKGIQQPEPPARPCWAPGNYSLGCAELLTHLPLFEDCILGLRTCFISQAMICPCLWTHWALEVPWKTAQQGKIWRLKGNLKLVCFWGFWGVLSCFYPLPASMELFCQRLHMPDCHLCTQKSN